MTQTAATAPAYTVKDLRGGVRNFIGLARVSTDGQDRGVGLSGRIFPPTALIVDKHCELSVRQGASPQVARSGIADNRHYTRSG